MTQQHDATLLTVRSDVGDKTGCAHVIEDIIFYSWTVVPYNIGVSLP
jgi:hypothetical protein